MATLLVMALSWLYTIASIAAPADAAPRHLSENEGASQKDSITISLVTCFPGPEIFELYGHEGIRVRGNGVDSVWNYGVFDFREPNFVYRFVKGETDYMGASYPFEWFLPEYLARGSKVVEQDLNLTQEEARRLLGLLRTSTLPENRKYRYNYVKDNCSTRVYRLVEQALDERVIYPDTVHYGTFRNEMRSYNEGYPWYQFGIDIALGSGIDHDLKAEDEMFVPVELMRMASGAHLSDGRKLVKDTRLLNEGIEKATLPPTPWYAAPLFWSWIVFAALCIFCLVSLKCGKIVKVVYSLWFLILGLAGLVVTFLVFVSSHEATSPNALIFWLNPLQLLLAVCLWWRPVRIVAMVIAVLDVVAMLCLLVVWPFQTQSANPAFFPLMGTTLIMAATYAILCRKSSYNNNGQTSLKSVKKSSKKK